MKQNRDRFIWATAIMATLLGGVTAGVVVRHWDLFSKHDAILDIESFPTPSAVHLVGVVTYTDIPGNRFWIQDKTGAIIISGNPVGIHAGQTVAVEAIKTARYDPSNGPDSMALKEVRLDIAAATMRLPPPLPATLTEFPVAEQNGVRVQITGIVRDVWMDNDRQAHLIIADDSPSVDLVIARPDRDYSKLIDASVRAVGVTEEVRDAHGVILSKRIWVSSGGDLKVEQPAPNIAPLYSIRTLYLSGATGEGHRIRIRGWIAAVYSDSILLEDRWGAITCKLSRSRALKPGLAVEVDGFPVLDSMMINLAHARITKILAAQAGSLKESGSGLAPLTSVAAIHSLPMSKAAQFLPVRVTGVITALDPAWTQLFFQEGKAGIFVRYAGQYPKLSLGQRVTLMGMTGPGDYAPVIVAPKLRIDGPGRLPIPIPVTEGKAATGLLDSRFVTMEGIVHSMEIWDQTDHPIVTFGLQTNLGLIHAYTTPLFFGLGKLKDLTDAKVRVEAPFGALYNARRQQVGYQLEITLLSQVEVLEPPLPHPFEMKATPIGSLLRYSPDAKPGHRVKVAGSVTMVGRDFLYLQDKSGGVEVLGNTGATRLGERMEAIGYPTLVGAYSPILTDATFRATAVTETTIPKAVEAESIMQDDAQLVTVIARLLSVLREPDRTSLVLQSGVQTFTAQLDTSEAGADLPNLREGSVLRLTGVCSAQIDSTRTYHHLYEVPVSFKILLRSPADVSVVQAAPFWTPQMALILLPLFVLAFAAVLLWVGALRRRVRRQEMALEKASQTAHAIQNLAAAMCELAKGQRFDTAVPVEGSEEIAQLVIGFNHMLSDLQQMDSARQEAEAKLRQQALLDELTGLPNRRLMFDRLLQGLAAAKRDGHTLALLFIDLDGFKLVNDGFGHDIGDLLLRAVAQRFRSRIRESDTLARIGGDEFTVILNHLQNRAVAGTIAANLLESVQSPISVGAHQINIGASIGISIFPTSGVEGNDLLRQADSAMYEAKRSGKNRVVYFSGNLEEVPRA